MSKKKQGKSQKLQFSAYQNEGRYAKNTKRKLTAYCKRNPNDQQAQKRLDKGEFVFKRKKPFSKKWSQSQRNFAQTIAFCGGNGNTALREVTHS